MSVKQDTLP